ncbi:DUF1592 domain-containing protein [bacterium]|nr:DUF1592 domain-containing protein [bacterium]
MRKISVFWAIATLVRMACSDESAKLDSLGKEFLATTRPLIAGHCLECHSTAKREGELDLERFAQLEDVRQDAEVWRKVIEQIETGQMPPKEAKPLSADKKRDLLSWVDRYLKEEARAHAGDPGAVVLRRLTNAEYTYTIQDITGVDLQPAKEFPVDSAAGEGFTNTGSALVMSPALFQKYLDAGKEIARHAVLLPTGLRFSSSTTRGDWNKEILDRIRAIYRQYTEVGGATPVNLQGIVFNTNDGGLIPLAKYLDAGKECARLGTLDFQAVADRAGLNAKYLTILVSSLDQPSPRGSLLNGLRDRLIANDPSSELASSITRWQHALTKFQNVGHMKSWMVPTDPLVSRREMRWKFPADLTDPTKNPSLEVKIYLVTSDAGDGAEGDSVVWENPRLVAPGRPDLPLRDVRAYVAMMVAQRGKLFASTAEVLQAAFESQGLSSVDRSALAKKYQVEESTLTAWFDYLGIGTSAASSLDLFTQQVKNLGGYDTVTGWGSPDLPSLIANASDTDYRVPGVMKAHGIGVHPSPTMRVGVGWKSPLAGSIRIEGKVTHAHPECGNGVVWGLTIRRATTRRTLVEGVSHGAAPVAVGPIDNLVVEPGDLVSIIVGPRDGDHACDLTSVEITLSELAGEKRVWNLSQDVAGNILAGNPHADSRGAESIWHFYQEKVDESTSSVIPANSLLARWQSATSPDEARQLADQLERLLINGLAPQTKVDEPDYLLYQQLASLGGGLLSRVKIELATANHDATAPQNIGLPADRFGKSADGSTIDATSLAVQAPSVMEVTLPAELVAGGEFVTSATLHPGAGREGSVQVDVTSTRTPAIDAMAKGNILLAGFTSLDPTLPIIVLDESQARQRFLASFRAFRELFPAALCYFKIVPVDEVITLTLFHREDEPLCRLMLSDEQKQELDRLWRELHFVSRDKLTSVDAFLQLLEYASQDGRPSDFEPFREPIQNAAASFKQEMLDAEPEHLRSVLQLADKAFRRPLTTDEQRTFRDLYSSLRGKGIAHDEAIVLVLARVLVSPRFLYRLEQLPAEGKVSLVNDYELASRLSYFLWSAPPDDALLQLAAEGKLQQPETLKEQARRMLQDPKSQRLAREFGLQWLQIYGFRTLDEKSERHFPEFQELRADMEEEAVRYLGDLFAHDGSLSMLVDSDHTFVNDRLADFYGIPNVVGPEWRRVEGVRKAGRGGILGLAATLAKNAGASRTSPILRGTWMSEVILGEKLPKPPKNVPILPDEDSSTAELSVRQLVEKHSSDEKCAVCHRRIDPFGFAFENYDAIGRYRTKDLAEHPIDAKTTLPDGTSIDGPNDLRRYLLDKKREVVLGQFLKKLLGYSLGRSVQLSDQPLLDEIQTKLRENEDRFSLAIEMIVQSPAFRSIRGPSANTTLPEG